MTAGMLGGITGAISEDDPTTPSANGLRVAGSQHRRDLHLAQRGRVGDRRAAHPGEPEADADADVAQAAAHPAEQRQREVEEPVGDAGLVGDAARAG